MQRQGVLHLLLFVIFFGIGAGALGVAVLCDDLVEHCRNKHLVQEAESSLRRLESLNTEYDVLIEQLENDPNLLKRIAPVTLGAQPEEPCAVYPKAKARELAVARKALLEQADQEVTEAPVPLPKVTHVSPALGKAGQAMTFTIRGQYFTGAEEFRLVKGGEVAFTQASPFVTATDTLIQVPIILPETI